MNSGRGALTAAEIQLLTRLPGLVVWSELRLVLRADQVAALEWRRQEMLARGELLAPASAELAAP